MMRILIENDWVDHEFLDRHTIGYDELRAKVLTYSLDEVEAVTGESTRADRRVDKALRRAKARADPGSARACSGT